MELTTIDDVRAAEKLIHRHLSPTPLIRSYDLERELGLAAGRCVWLKDYGWSPVGSFKLLGAINWVYHQLPTLRASEAGDSGEASGSQQAVLAGRPVAAHSSGNFASGLAFAGALFETPVYIVMPDTAPQVKFRRTKSYGANVLTYDKSRDHETGERDRLAAQLADEQNAIQASPYDNNHVIAGNGVGGLEIVTTLQAAGRSLDRFVCPVSGGGLMAGHAIAIAAEFPQAEIIGVEPAGADDFRQSLAKGERVRVAHPQSICDGLLSYDVGVHNWPLLQKHVRESIPISDESTCQAMRWLFERHGLRTEPSGAIAVAALLEGDVPEGDGDIVVVVSGRNVDDDDFFRWIA